MNSNTDHPSALNGWRAKVIFILPILALLIIFRDVLFAGRIFSDGDSFLYFYPLFKIIASSKSLVTPSILSGFPLYTSVNASWFYPVYSFLFRFFDLYNGYHYLTLLNFILAYVGTYWYTRSLKVSHAGSSIAGAVFIFSGQLMMWGSVIVNTNYYWILPFVLYGIEHAKKGGYYSSYLLLSALLLGTGWLSSHTQFIVYIHAFVFCYYLRFCIVPVRKDAARAMYRTVLMLIMFGISAAIGYVQIHSILSFTSQTARAGGVALSEAFAGSYLPQDLLQYIIPFWRLPFFPAAAPNLYIGIIPFILLVYALWNNKQNSTVRFFAFTFFVSLVTGFYYSPVALLIHYLPFAHAFRELSRLMLIGDFAAAMLAAFAFDRLAMSTSDERFLKLLLIFKKVLLWVGAPLVFIATVSRLFFTVMIEQVLQGLFFKFKYANTAHLAPEHYQALIRQYTKSALDIFSLTNPQTIVSIIFIVLLFVACRQRARVHQSGWALLIMLLIVCNTTCTYAGFYTTVPRALAESEPASIAAISDDRSNDQPFRIFSLFTGVAEYDRFAVNCSNDSAEDRLAFEQALAVPNINIQYELESADGYENFMPKRIAELLAYVGSERATAGELLSSKKIPVEERIQEFTRRTDVLRLMNVQYVLSPYQINDPGLFEIYHGDLPGCGGTDYVYKLLNAMPRYFFTDKAEQLKSSSDDIDALAHELGQAMHNHSIVLETAAVHSAEEGTALIAELQPETSGDKITFTVNEPKSGYVFVGNAWLPGWHASVDSKPVTIERADYMYMAVPVEAGSHRIEFFYER